MWFVDDIRDDFIAELRRMFEELTAFTSMMTGRGMVLTPQAGASRQPHEEAIETERDYILTLELPGVQASEISVCAGKRAIEVEAKDPREPEGVLVRSYTTDADIKPKELKVTYKNGVLEIRAPKK